MVAVPWVAWDLRGTLRAGGAAGYRASGGARRRAAVYEVGGRPAHDTSQPTAATDARAACCHRRVHVQAHAPPRVKDYVHTRAPPRPSASVVTSECVCVLCV